MLLTCSQIKTRQTVVRSCWGVRLATQPCDLRADISGSDRSEITKSHPFCLGCFHLAFRSDSSNAGAMAKLMALPELGSTEELCFSALMWHLAFLRDVLLLGDQCLKMLTIDSGQVLYFQFQFIFLNTQFSKSANTGGMCMSDNVFHQQEHSKLY